MTFARVGRAALFTAIVLTAAALFATVWTMYRGVRASSATVVSGEVRALQSEISDDFREDPHQAYDDVVAAHADEGLLSLARLDRDLAGPPTRRSAEGAIKVGPSRYRAIARPRHMPPLVFEFSPVIARELDENASATLLVGSLAAGGFLAGALALGAWFLRREAAERRLAHERRLASLGQMSAVLAHEIRNPLASLKGNAQLLARALPADDEKARAKIDRVVDEAVRLETLTNDLLEFAKSGGDVHKAAVDPEALLRDVADAVGAARVRVEAANAPATWPMDRDRMRQVLLNLVENAVQAADAGDVITTVRAQGGKLAFVVRDHGPGLPPDELDRVFEPFFTKRVHGTGLGLAVARRFVELHGGTIAAANATDGGAVFTVLIPGA